MVRLSYSHDSKSAIFSWSERMFYILRTYAYDTWNIFYGLLKSHSSPQTHKEWGSLTELQRLECQKSTQKSLFLWENMHRLSHGHDSTCATFPDLGKCFTYSRHLRTTHEKISTGFWTQILWQKHTQNYSSKMSWPHLRLFKVHLNLKNHQKTLRH